MGPLESLNIMYTLRLLLLQVNDVQVMLLNLHGIEIEKKNKKNYSTASVSAQSINGTHTHTLVVWLVVLFVVVDFTLHRCDPLGLPLLG